MRGGDGVAAPLLTAFRRSLNRRRLRGVKPVDADGRQTDQPAIRTISTARSGTW